MTLKSRLARLEGRGGGKEPARIVVCWHQAGEECDCPPAARIANWTNEELEAIVNGPGPDVRRLSDEQLRRLAGRA